MTILRAQATIYNGDKIVYRMVSTVSECPTPSVLDAYESLRGYLESSACPPDVYMTRIEVVLLDKVDPDIEAFLIGQMKAV